MNRLVVIGVITVFLAVCVSPCIITANPSAAEDAVEEDMSGTDRGIIVLTDRPLMAFIELDYPVSFQNTLDLIDSSDIVVIDGQWIENQDQTTIYDEVRTMVDNGNPILLAADSYDAISSDRLGISTGYSSSADIYGIMVDSVTGTTYCYSVSDVDMTSSIETALRWIDSTETKIIKTRASNTTESPTLCAVTEKTDSFGKTVAESKHTKYPIDSETALILTEYNYSADPDMESSIWDNWIAVADMEIICNHLDSDLLDHGPTSSNSESYSVDIFAEDEESSVSVSGNWNYTIKESNLDDKTRYEIFDIYHDIDEKGDDKLSTKVMKPGTISLATKGNNPYLYHETEYYYTTFYKDSIVVSDKYADCNSDLIVSIF